MNDLAVYRKVLSSMMYLFLSPSRNCLHYPEDAMLLEGVAARLLPKAVDANLEWRRMEKMWRKRMPRPKPLTAAEFWMARAKKQNEEAKE